MKNCLVTKLKATVDNDSLFKLGEFVVEKAEIVRFKAAEYPVNVRIISGGTFPDGTKSYLYGDGYPEI